MAILTDHAEDRLVERCGLNKRSLQRIADKALESGIKHKDTKGRLKKWVDGVYLEYRNSNNIRLYGDKIFIFNDEVLITVFQIPQNLQKDLKNMIKTK